MEQERQRQNIEQEPVRQHTVGDEGQPAEVPAEEGDQGADEQGADQGAGGDGEQGGDGSTE